MILIDTLFINNGGRKVLLDYLISELNKSKLQVFHLLDERIKGKYTEIIFSRAEYLKGSFLKRHSFYTKNKYGFSKVLCFGNLPSSIKMAAEVFTYFHQPMYFDIPEEFSRKERFKFKLKIEILKLIAKTFCFINIKKNVFLA